MSGKSLIPHYSKEMGVQEREVSSPGEAALPHQEGNVDLQNPHLVPVGTGPSPMYP